MRHVFYEDDRVRFGIYDDNEYAVESKIPDPPKVRLAVDVDRVDEGNLGAVTWNLRRADGRHEEWVSLGGQLTLAGGALAIAVRRLDDDHVRDVLHINPERIYAHVPVVTPEAGAAMPSGSFLRSPNGRYDLEMQDDGVLVAYDEHDGHRPLWKITRDGELVPLP